MPAAGVHRWDFESEEEWSRYKQDQEAMPKAAFQFGVKMADGRNTKKGKHTFEQLNPLVWYFRWPLYECACAEN